MGRQAAFAAGHGLGPLYHGTTHELEGDTLLPGKRIGATQSDTNRQFGQSSGKVVSATQEEHHAWNLAAYQSGDPGAGRVRVHELEPHPEAKIGVEHRDHPEFQRAWAEDRYRKPPDHSEVVAPSFKVKETHFMPPGAQGALIGTDWNKHRPARTPKGMQLDENLRQPRTVDQVHRDALVEHADREGIEPGRPAAYRARLASKPRPSVLNPRQLGMFT